MFRALETYLAVFTCFVACGFAARAQDIDVVLDKAEQALGGAKVLGELQTIRIRSHGKWEMPSRQIPPTPFQAEVVLAKDGRIRLTWIFPEELGGTFIFGFDGKDTWESWGAPPARCTGWHRDMVLQMATEMQLYFIAQARAKHGNKFSLEPSKVEEDAALEKVVYRPIAAGKPWVVWFDKASGHIVKLEHDSYHMDGQLVQSRITRFDPKPYDGLNYPEHAKIETLREGQVIERADETVDLIEGNPTLAQEYFVCPKWDVDVATMAVKDVPAEMVVKILHRGPYSDIAKSLEPMMDVIMSSGLVPVGAASGAYLNAPNAVSPLELRTELAVRVAKLQQGEPALPEGYEFTTRPAMRVAYAYHRGDYNQEGEAHARLKSWMAGEGLKAAGLPRAIWYHDPEVTVEEDLVTEIQMPVRE